MFVGAAAIDPGSGLVSPAESRRSPEFGRVGVRTGDLRGHGGQLTVQLAPDVFRLRSRRSLFASSAYTLQRSRRQFRGFDGASFGDPRRREWAAAPGDARHVVVLQGGVSAPRLGTVTLFGRAQSGLPFTPIVQGDVDGDGRAGDRAFVPDPARVAAADPALAAGMRALLADAPDHARRCLAAALGRAAARNGCRGPWTQTLNVQWRPPIPERWGRRVRSNVYLENVLAGVDQLVHGDERLRGWGAPALPDPVLLVPRGFDAAASGGPRFRYDVNPRFGLARGARALVRTPFRLTVDFSVDLAVPFPVQQLRRAVEPVRAPDGTWGRRTADSLAAFYLARTSSIHRALLAESDSLFLSAGQTAALRRADSAYSARVRAVYVPLGRFLAARPDARPGKVEMDSVEAAQRAYSTAFWEQPEVADSILTPTQRALMPMLVLMLGVSPQDRANMQVTFGFPVTLTGEGGTGPRPGVPGRRIVDVP